MKRLLLAASLATLLLSSAAAFADDDHHHRHGYYHDRHDHDDDDDDDDDRRHYHRHRHRDWRRDHYRRGEHIDVVYVERRYYVDDYDYYHLRQPPRGHRWIRTDDGKFILIAVASGIIADVLLHH